jgi:hypothetical protein
LKNESPASNCRASSIKEEARHAPRLFVGLSSALFSAIFAFRSIETQHPFLIPAGVKAMAFLGRSSAAAKS